MNPFKSSESQTVFARCSASPLSSGVSDWRWRNPLNLVPLLFISLLILAALAYLHQ